MIEKWQVRTLMDLRYSAIPLSNDQNSQIRNQNAKYDHSVLCNLDSVFYIYHKSNRYLGIVKGFDTVQEST